MKDTADKFLVAASGPHTVVMARLPPLSREDALNLVAWVSVVASLTDVEILEARRQVEST